MARLVGRFFLLGAAALWIAGLGASAAQAKTVRIIMDNMEFSPAEATAAAGDTVEWVNRDFLAHTATAADAKWEIVLPAGSTKQLQIKEAGKLDYYCRYHPNMKGSITVGK